MIRPTFLSFETAKRAIAIGQLGLDTVGHNISNANTPGYTRQRVDQVSINSAGYATKYQTFGVQFPGQGSDIRAINQIRDPYLDNRYRAEAATNGELAVKSDGLSDINSIFDEILTNGLHSKLGDLVNSLDIFAAQADSKELAMVVQNTANQLVQILNKNSKDLESARVQQKTDFDVTVEEKVNNIIEKIAELNVKIKEDNFYGNPSNELNDDRNYLLDQLSEYVDIKIVRTPVKISDDFSVERVSVELKNSGEPPIQLIDSGSYNKFKVVEDSATGNVSIKLVEGIAGGEIDLDSDSSNGVSGDLTNMLHKGALKGYIDIINGAGPSASSGSTFKGIPYYQASLNEFASKIADIFNSVNNISEQEALANGVTATNDTKNLFVPLSLSISGNTPDWIESVSNGNLEMSGKNYAIAFDNSGFPEVKATIDGDSTKVYTANYVSGDKMDFLDENGKVAFSVTTSNIAPTGDSNVTVDANINANNISISQSWLNDSLFLTATKFPPSTKLEPKLITTGNAPAWIKSVDYGKDGIAVADGNYKFEKVGTEIQVKIGSDVFSVDESEFVAGKQIKFTNGSNQVGLIVTLSDKPFGTTAAENTVTIKNTTGALNDNVLKFKEAMKSANGYSVSGFRGNFEEFIISFQREMALDKSLNTSLLDASMKVISGFADSRDAISAVSVDEEGINMMQYQNFYNAAARYMTTLDEALDKIINGMGVVGR